METTDEQRQDRWFIAFLVAPPIPALLPLWCFASFGLNVGEAILIALVMGVWSYPFYVVFGLPFAAFCMVLNWTNFFLCVLAGFLGGTMLPVAYQLLTGHISIVGTFGGAVLFGTWGAISAAVNWAIVRPDKYGF